MTWQDPGGNTPPKGPDDDATRADWDLAQLDALVGAGGAGAPEPATPEPPAAAPPGAVPTPAAPVGPPGAPPAPSTPPAWSAPPPSPGYGLAPGYGPAPGYAPGYPPATAPGMAWAPPPTGTLAGGLRYAGTPERFVAYLVDGIVMTLIGWAIYGVAAIAGAGPFATLSMSTTTGRYSPLTASLAPGAVALLVFLALVSAAISAAYFVLQWSGSHRATLGMRVLGLQVGNAADGRTITRGQAFRRWIALGGWVGIIGALPPLSTLVSLGLLAWEVILLVTVVGSPTKQGLHDRFADTAMVQSASGSGNGLVVGCVLVIGAFVLMFVVAFVALIFLGGQVSSILSTVGDSI